MEILGDGTQTKSYVHVDDCNNAILLGFDKANEKVNIFNIGSEDFVDVKKISDLVCKEMNIQPKYNFTGGDKGWVGDVRHMQLDASKLKSLSWNPKFNSESAIVDTLRNLLNE